VIRGEWIDVHQIRPPEDVPRHADRDPLVVRPIDDSNSYFELVAGYTAYSAAASSRWDRVGVIIRTDDATDPLDRLRDFMTLRLSDPIEQGRAFQEAMDRTRCSQRELAQLVGFAQPLICKRVKLLRLPAAVQRAISRRELTIEHALRLAG
jgi:ParB family chromosome partitioning protein